MTVCASHMVMEIILVLTIPQQTTAHWAPSLHSSARSPASWAPDTDLQAWHKLPGGLPFFFGELDLPLAPKIATAQLAEMILSFSSGPGA